MSIKSKVLASAAMLAMVGGFSAVGTLPARAATPQCGTGCITIFSREFGTSIHPTFVETVFRGVAKAGQPMILHRTSRTNPAEDLLPSRAGLVSDLFRAGLVSAAVNRHYGRLRATQIEYAPWGVASRLCVGLASTAFQNEGLTLQRCGVSARTVWIVDAADSPATAPDGFFPLVNGSTTNFCHPFAMTYPRGAHPTGKRPARILVHTLINNPAHVPDRQLWGTTFGVLR
jgi:hypothetical protein